jgi:hypothetical protein
VNDHAEASTVKRPRTARRFVVATALVGSAAAALIFVVPSFADTSVDRTFSDPRITESSGLAVSPRHDGVLYTHNDSDDGPLLYAIGRDGDTAATLTLRGAEARDWEAVATSNIDGRARIWVGDIGDNIRAWPTIRVYRVAERGELRTRDVPWTQFDFEYEDGPRDAESLMVHPQTGRLYVVTKLVNGQGVYEAPARLSATGTNVLRRVASARQFATDAAFSPDGRFYVVRGYVGATVYSAAPDDFGRKVADVALPVQPQGESIAWSADGRYLYAGSEGRGAKVFRVDLPDEVLPVAGDEPALDPTPTSTVPPSDRIVDGEGEGSGGPGSALPRDQLLWIGAGALVLIALGFSLRSWSRTS